MTTEKAPSRRRHSRVPTAGKVHLGWTDPQGQERTMTAVCVDVAEPGLKLEGRERVPIRTVVMFRAEGLNLHGSATVRYCITHKNGFRIGIEFIGGLKWKGQPSGRASAG